MRKPTAEVRLDCLTPDPRFELPADPKLTDRIALARKREIPVTRATVPLPDIRVHDSERMRQIRAALLEAPSLCERIATALHDPAYPRMLLFRDLEGRLVMFDDYVGYAVAEDLGMSEVRAMILGEGTDLAQPSDFALWVQAPE